MFAAWQEPRPPTVCLRLGRAKFHLSRTMFAAWQEPRPPEVCFQNGRAKFHLSRIMFAARLEPRPPLPSLLLITIPTSHIP